MFYVYVLRSLSRGSLYTGSTSDLKKRVHEHNAGTGGQHTSRNGPYKLIYYEAYLSKTDALKQELFYKSGYGREVLKEKLINSLTNLGG